METHTKIIGDHPKFGDIVQLTNNLWLIVGDGPKDIPNIILYRVEDRLYLLDSGARPEMRASIVKVLEKVGPMQSFTLLNSHGHADHVGNNDVIQVAHATEKYHYLSKEGLDLLDPVSYFTGLSLRLSAHYDMVSAYQADRLKWQLLKRIRDTAIFFAGERAGWAMAWSLYLRNFQPFHPSRETMTFYETLPRQTITIGGVQWSGWALGKDDVWVLEERGHTVDEMLFYLPEHQLLFTADLAFPMFPTFPDTNGKQTREMLQRCYEMATAGVVNLLINSHTLSPAVYHGKEEAVSFLGTIIDEHDRFQGVLREILEEQDGLTVSEVYSSLQQRQSDPAVRHYLLMEYPDHPMSLQQIITVNLVQMGYEAHGHKGKQRFYRPANNTPSPNDAQSVPEK